MGACIWQCILSCTRAGHLLCLTLVCCPPSHRTHVASNACGNEHGLAENCELCSVKIRQENGGLSWCHIIEAFRHVINNCNVAAGERCVINLSVGLHNGRYYEDLKDVAAEAIEAGIVVVAAAGNDGEESLYSPQVVPEVITVGGIKRGHEPWEDTSYGDAVTVYAPAKLVFGADPESNMFQSGTSFAAPCESYTSLPSMLMMRIYANVNPPCNQISISRHRPCCRSSPPMRPIPLGLFIHHLVCN